MIEPGFKEVLDEALKLHDAKHSDYNGQRPAWKTYGMMGRFFDINRKFERIKTLLWEKKGNDVKDETVRDTLLDMIVYCALAIIVFDEERNNKLDQEALDRIPDGGQHE